MAEEKVSRRLVPVVHFNKDLEIKLIEEEVKAPKLPKGPHIHLITEVRIEEVLIVEDLINLVSSQEVQLKKDRWDLNHPR